MHLKRIAAILLLSIFASGLTARVDAQNHITVKGRLDGGAGYRALLVSASGESVQRTLGSTGRFKFNRLTRTFLRNATLHFVADDGSYYGPTVLAGSGGEVYLAFSGRRDRETGTVNLGVIQMNDPGYARPRRNVARGFYTRERITQAADGVPVGVQSRGLVQIVSSSSKTRGVRIHEGEEGGIDTDSDGILDVFDPDDDGDLVPDYADPESAATTAQDSPFTTLYLGLGQTLNINASSLTPEQIDAVVGGEDQFVLIFYIPIAPEDVSVITGGHVVCGSPLLYCRSTADGGGTAVYSGVSESDNSLRGQLWTDLNADGSGYPNLESIRDGQAMVAGIQPRVGTAEFRPGDVYVVELVSADGAVESRRTFTLPPYFITVPAIKSYDAGFGTVELDYPLSGSTAGASSGNPIVLSGSGALTLTMWRPQRGSVSDYEASDIMDMGHLHYGAIVGGVAQEFTCAGYYSGLSATLSENSAALGSGDSPLAENGAVLWPLDDAAADAVPSASNTFTFTVNLRDCLGRAGVASGTYPVTLTAAGENFSGGANRAAVTVYVTIP
ncbi:MAG: hypothetical protein QY326_02695 [Bdellovibrionota bacterium]|nr:MAG: hypothetical protein QY326_02695 [Bdellovibrionota bacterium]